MTKKNDNRGQAVAEFQKARRAKALKQVRDFYSEYPFATMKDAASALGFHYVTLARYVRELRKQDQAKG